jgi:hypothetical protein
MSMMGAENVKDPGHLRLISDLRASNSILSCGARGARVLDPMIQTVV